MFEFVWIFILFAYFSFSRKYEYTVIHTASYSFRLVNYLKVQTKFNTLIYSKYPHFNFTNFSNFLAEKFKAVSNFDEKFESTAHLKKNSWCVYQMKTFLDFQCTTMTKVNPLHTSAVLQNVVNGLKSSDFFLANKFALE